MRTSLDPRVRPFPWHDLPHTSGEAARSARRLRAAASTVVRLDEVSLALAELLGDTASVTRLVEEAAPAMVRGAGDVALLLARRGRQAPTERVFVGIEAPLAGALAARALRTPAAKLVDASGAAPPAVTGAVAAVVLGAARRAHGAYSLAVVAAGPADDLARDFLRPAARPVTLAFRVDIGKDAYRATVTAFADALPEPEARLTLAARARLASLPIALPLVAAVTVASRQDLAALTRGDVFLPMPRTMALDGEGPHAAVLGPVLLLAARAEEGLGCDLAPGGRLVLRRLRAVSPWDPPASRHAAPREPPMPDDLASATDTLTSLEDAPVVIRVELGVLEMTAGAYAALEAGDVIPLGRRIGDPAVLRAGGHEVGRGELVVVDGEVGIRMIERPREGT